MRSARTTALTTDDRPARDRWAEWLAERRCGGDREYEQKMLSELAGVRDRVLDGGALAAGETLLDVGCGDGLIAFGALERGAGAVIFSDISEDLLDECEARARSIGLFERCTFLRMPADDLGSVEDGAVDVVTTRSVLIYVDDKRRSFEEFFRVLRPGGRVSLFEPINRYFCEEPQRNWPYDLGAVAGAAAKLNALYDEIQPPGSDPMLDFGERDLVELADAAGFGKVHLELVVDVQPVKPERWDTFVHLSGNPKIPTLAEAMAEALTDEERERFVAHLRPLVEDGVGRERFALAYLSALKAGD